MRLIPSMIFMLFATLSACTIYADDVSTSVATTLSGSTLSSSSATPSKQKIWEPPFYNGIAAQVEKIIVSYDDIRREMAPMSPQIREQSKSQEEYDQRMNDLYHQTLQMLVERALLISEFKGRGYKVPPKESDNEYHKILKQNFDGHISDLVASLQQQGLTLPAYRKRLEENLMVSALQERFRHDLPEITPDQIQTFYKAHLNKFSRSGSVHLSVITLKPMTDEPADVLHQTASGIADQIKAGEDFDKAALEHNQEGQADWGWLATSELSEQVKETVANMKVGDVSAPLIIDGPKALLIKLIDRKNEGVAPIEDAREDIKRKLFEEQAETAYQKWIGQLKKKYFVKINV